ncbi:SRPBCC domain-containing protein [Gramella sp. AN32]|uniref:SRPBCC domain-containing protein n=1 Tax=Christiangramia antarctica TaxID=2058158 RepID=A0ABW5X7Q0_9FLAO|nr:SRPBCC domain-containing protein [Gramella sp. AN32]MCM4155560.1 ATPase [Gramella sp. AN32]
MKELEIKTAIQISKSPTDVFEAIVNPVKMSNYFISKGDARMETGKTVNWKFPEFPEMTLTVKVIEVKASELIVFEWEGAKDQFLEVRINLEEMPNLNTLVKISEGKMKNTVEGILWYGRNTEGWANFLACLKAYLEYDINLRNGAFDFMNSKKKR